MDKENSMHFSRECRESEVGGGEQVDGDKEMQCSFLLFEQDVNRRSQWLGSEFSMRVDLQRLLPQGF